MPITFISSDSSTPDLRSHGQNAVLLLDCSAEVHDRLAREGAAADLKVLRADSAAAAVTELRRREMPVLVSFSRGVGALKFISELRAHNAAALLLALVDSDRGDLVSEAVLAGVADVLTPDVSVARLQAAIARELAPAGAGVPAPGAAGPHDFYRQSPAMRDACDAMLRVPASRAGVLVSGERGSGRRMAARALHAAASATRPGQFVAVDCAAFEPQQLELELFGVAARSHEEHLPARSLERVASGSRLHAALGGTLYLENVPDASTRVQLRLGRLLRDREVVVDGSDSTVFDVRCITGAGEELAAAVRDGRMEDALHRRLTATRIDIPALRSRREDIPALANRFLREACASQRVPLKMFSRSALALFTALPWRRNAAELRDLLHLIIQRSPHRGIGVEDVLAHVRLDSGVMTLTHSGTLRQARSHFEHEYIAAVLRQHRGRITQAAKTLGIQRTNLYRKMRTLKVASPR